MGATVHLEGATRVLHNDLCSQISPWVPLKHKDSDAYIHPDRKILAVRGEQITGLRQTSKYLHVYRILDQLIESQPTRTALGIPLTVA